MIFLTLILLSLNSILVINGQMQCRDESGKPVDWYIVYKFPWIKGDESPLLSGFRYAFITSESKTGWTLSDHQIDNKTSIFGQTLQPLYATKLNSSISYINYNDQPPQANTSSGAHSKGVVASDASHGFWLIHSVPKFAAKESNHTYEYPSSGGRFGQTGLCLSFKLEEMDKVLEQMLQMQPNIYSKKFSEDLKKKFPKALDLDQEKWNSGKYSVKRFLTTNGLNITSFSKAPTDSVEFWTDLVAPELKTNLYVETWRQGLGTPLPSFCNKTQTVENVNELSVKFANSQEKATFDYLDDHSKWGMSTTSSHPYVCVGDINRMQSQYRRGGTTNCIPSALIWQKLKEWISKVEKCSEQTM